MEMTCTIEKELEEYLCRVLIRGYYDFTFSETEDGKIFCKASVPDDVYERMFRRGECELADKKNPGTIHITRQEAACPEFLEALFYPDAVPDNLTILELESPVLYSESDMTPELVSCIRLVLLRNFHSFRFPVMNNGKKNEKAGVVYNAMEHMVKRAMCEKAEEESGFFYLSAWELQSMSFVKAILRGREDPGGAILIDEPYEWM